MTAYPYVPDPGVDSDPALAQLLDQLQERHNNAICCTLLYGSCLRSGDIYDGLMDLYLICDSYRNAYGRPLLAATNWLLPPNVFYTELKLEERTLRSKVTVISLEDFQRGCTRAWFESYIWGRFAQPARIIYSQDDSTRVKVEEALLEAARTLLVNTIPSLPPQGTVSDLWQKALSLSYSTELRTEGNGRARELADYARDFYESLTRHHADSLDLDFAVYDDAQGLRYRSNCTRAQQRHCTLAWSLRRAQGKLLSIMRLLKALFTFEGGLDYIAWKLERHSGEEIVIPAKVRRAPLIFMWGFFWGLYRRGIFK